MKAKKTLILVVAVALIAAIAIGGTLAYLTAETKTVTNTFTVGNVKIDLTETVDGKKESAKTAAVTNNNFKLIPGDSFDKDPTVTVEEGSEACWLFLKVAPNTNWTADITYSIDTEVWNAVPDHAGYYYASADKDEAAAGKDFNVLTGKTVSVKTDVTQEHVNTITADNAPAIVFSAAAVQSANLDTVAKAWAALPTAFTGATPEAEA